MRTCLVWEPKELLVTICVMCGLLKKKSKTFSHSNLSDPTFKVFLGMPCIAPDCSLFVLTSLSSNLHKDQSSKFCFRLIHILHPWSLPVMRTGIYPSCHWSRSRVHPGQVASITQSLHRETHNMTFTFTPDSELWVSIQREPKQPQSQHANSTEELDHRARLSCVRTFQWHLISSLADCHTKSNLFRLHSCCVII